MTTNRPLVSVIVPVYNREDYLRDALDSIVTQDYRPLEVIVVDDGSTDGTAGVARSYPEVLCLRQANQGVAVARNAGVAASRGVFLAFLDSDDCWTPGKVTLQVDFLQQHPEVDYCVGHIQNYLQPGCRRPGWVTAQEMGDPQALPLPSTLLVRREAFARVGGFDGRYTPREDTEWLFRARQAGIVSVMLPETLVYRRIHDTNLSSTRGAMLPTLARILKESMERQRQRSPAVTDR